ncbi:MAG: hypothetical protein ACN0LA_00575, partial [Candidatus Longimicrobiales bacterium M2_2A_002]
MNKRPALISKRIISLPIVPLSTATVDMAGDMTPQQIKDREQLSLRLEATCQQLSEQTQSQNPADYLSKMPGL